MDNKLPEFELIPIFLSKAKKIMQCRIGEVLKPYDLTGAHAMFLTMLRKNGGMSLKELSESVHVDKAMTTRIIAEMSNKGYIVDDRQSVNARKYKVYLTAQGMEAAVTVSLLFEQLREDLFGLITPEEKQQLFHIAQKLICLLEISVDDL